jgi:hypothetical protein
MAEQTDGYKFTDANIIDANGHVPVEFTIDGETVTEVFDARYVPTGDKESLSAWANDYIAAYKAGKTQQDADLAVDPAAKQIARVKQDAATAEISKKA